MRTQEKFNENRSCIEILSDLALSQRLLRLMKTEVVLKFWYINGYKQPDIV